MTTDPAASPDSAAILVELGAQATVAYERPDLESGIRRAQARLARPDTVVCIVGEFKQGKSSLINALLGRDICPVDDDFATTAVTVLRAGAEAGATVHRRTSSADGSTLLTEAIPLERIAEYVSEQQNPDNAARVELVEIVLPHPMLDRGITLVDTPGIGGLSAGHVAATLAFLPSADALIFVSDASQELSAPEVEFLQRARQACPTVLMALTKIDLYPRWRLIRDLDAKHLSDHGVAIIPHPVSSALRQTAFQLRDATLNDQSGVPLLLQAIEEQVLHGAATTAQRLALAEVRSALDQMRTAFETERAALADPAALEAALAQITQVKERLDQLRGAGSRWSMVLTDGFADLSSTTDYQFRSSLRTLSREIGASIDESDPGSDWDALSERIQLGVATAVQDAFTRLRRGATEIQAGIDELIGEEGLGIEADGAVTIPIDVRSLWRDHRIESPSLGSRIGGGLGAVRGAQGGLYVFGFLTQMVGVAVMGPALVGVGAAFGGKALLDDRRRQVAARRQQARTFYRDFEESTQFEVGAQIRDTTRELQREIRDRVMNRLQELTRTYTETLQSLQQTGAQDQELRQQRAALLATRIGKLDEVLRRVAMLDAP